MKNIFYFLMFLSMIACKNEDSSEKHKSFSGGDIELKIETNYENNSDLSAQLKQEYEIKDLYYDPEPATDHLCPRSEVEPILNEKVYPLKKFFKYNKLQAIELVEIDNIRIVIEHNGCTSFENIFHIEFNTTKDLSSLQLINDALIVMKNDILPFCNDQVQIAERMLQIEAYVNGREFDPQNYFNEVFTDEIGGFYSQIEKITTMENRIVVSFLFAFDLE